MRRTLDAIVRLWRDRVSGPVLRSYDAAREELGGVPWRNFASTERWFLGTQPPPLPPGAGKDDKPITLDTAAIIITGPSWRERLGRLEARGRYFLGGAALLIVVFLVIAVAGSSGSAAHTPPSLAAAAAALPAAPAPAVAPATAPAVAPAQAVAPVKQAAPKAVSGQLSPDLQALLDGTGRKGSAKASSSSSKKVARVSHKKGRRR
jgi:hypothetical protein